MLLEEVAGDWWELRSVSTSTSFHTKVQLPPDLVPGMADAVRDEEGVVLAAAHLDDLREHDVGSLRLGEGVGPLARDQWWCPRAPAQLMKFSSIDPRC